MFRYGREKALAVREKAVSQLGEREVEHLRGMLEQVVVDTPRLETATLIELRAAYEENYDEVWLGDSDAGDHEADDYYQGYEAGAAMVLGLLCEAWNITPETGPEVSREVRA